MSRSWPSRRYIACTGASLCRHRKRSTQQVLCCRFARSTVSMLSTPASAAPLEKPAAASSLVLFLSGSLGTCMLAMRFSALLCVIAEAYPCDAEKTAKELLPLIEQHNSLRPGSYSASMEEVPSSAPCLMCVQTQPAQSCACPKAMPAFDRITWIFCLPWARPGCTASPWNGPALDVPCCAAAGRSPCLHGLSSAWEAGHH